MRTLLLAAICAASLQAAPAPLPRQSKVVIDPPSGVMALEWGAPKNVWRCYFTSPGVVDMVFEQSGLTYYGRWEFVARDEVRFREWSTCWGRDSDDATSCCLDYRLKLRGKVWKAEGRHAVLRCGR